MHRRARLRVAALRSMKPGIRSLNMYLIYCQWIVAVKLGYILFNCEMNKLDVIIHMFDNRATYLDNIKISADLSNLLWVF